MIYLDNAATTFPKPERVINEAFRFTKNYCGNPGRSSHRLSQASAREIFLCREAIAELFGGSPENVVLTMNATYALNIAIHGLYRGGEILISNIEHNAVYRPVSALAGDKVRIFNASGDEKSVIASFISMLTPKTSLVVCCHTSNVCGITLPVEKIGAICRKRRIPFIVDASQSAGILPIDIKKCSADAICAPGHKGLYGLQGSGFALFSDECAGKAGECPAFISGGTGVNSLDSGMPDFLPERFEAGTLPTPSAVGLRYGIAEVRKIGIENINRRETELSEKTKSGLLNINGVNVYAPEYRGGSVLFNIEGMKSSDVGGKLDEMGICVRSGFHCSPLAHKLLKTGGGGAVRVSFSVFNREKDVDALLYSVNRISAGRSR